MFVYNLPPINTILLIKASLFFYGDNMKLVNFKIEKETLERFDNVCGIIPRSAYIRRMIENEIQIHELEMNN